MGSNEEVCDPAWAFCFTRTGYNIPTFLKDLAKSSLDGDLSSEGFV